MVAGSETNKQLLERVAEIYKWLDMQICTGSDMARVCRSCGDCCDFEGFDHRLFITPPELMYLAANLSAENIKPMLSSRCPYNIDGKCSVYEYRFSGCRIFCCDADADFQSRLSEAVLDKLKSICTEFQIPYRYTDLAAGLSSLAGV
jgi:Fe-S-cluster containining protein